MKAGEAKDDIRDEEGPQFQCSKVAIGNIDTRCVLAMKSVRSPITLHIVIGCNDVLRYHWLFENLRE